MKKYRFIDSLRGLAILGVLLVHSTLFMEFRVSDNLQYILSQGARGVQLFYMVSALTLFLSYNYRSKKEKNLNLNFYIRRFFRIAPLYYLALVFYLFFLGLGSRYWLGGVDFISIENIVASFTFTNGWNPFWINSIFPVQWSIPIEVTFYLFIPLLFRNIKNLRGAIVFFIISIIISRVAGSFLMGVVGTDYRLYDEFRYLWFPNQLPIFATGIIAYFLIKDKINLKKINTVLVGTVLLILAVGLFILAKINFPIPYYPRLYIIGLSFLSLTISLYIFPNKLLVNKVTGFIGRISFGLYLSHIATLSIIFNFVDGFIRNNGIETTANIKYAFIFILNLILASIISYILHIVVEKNFIKIGKSIIRKIDQGRKYILDKEVRLKLIN